MCVRVGELWWRGELSLPRLACHMPPPCAPWSCGKPCSASGKNRGSCSTCPGLDPGGQDKGTSLCSFRAPLPLCLFPETTGSSESFPSLWRCKCSSEKSLHVTSGVQTLMSKSLCPSLYPAPPVFHTDVPPFVTCFHIFFGLSLIPEWIFPFVFPSSVPSFSLNPFFIICFFYFSYNPAH